jgi:hypothetical protein
MGKKNVNLKGENVVASNLNNIKLSNFWKLWKLDSKTNIVCYFFKKMSWLPKKQKSTYFSRYKSTLNESRLLM